MNFNTCIFNCSPFRLFKPLSYQIMMPWKFHLLQVQCTCMSKTYNNILTTRVYSKSSSNEVNLPADSATVVDVKEKNGTECACDSYMWCLPCHHHQHFNEHHHQNYSLACADRLQHLSINQSIKTCSTCAQKLTDGQLSLLHETKNCKKKNFYV